MIAAPKNKRNAIIIYTAGIQIKYFKPAHCVLSYSHVIKANNKNEANNFSSPFFSKNLKNVFIIQYNIKVQKWFVKLVN